jgi:hypothetical protein
MEAIIESIKVLVLVFNFKNITVLLLLILWTPETQHLVIRHVEIYA